MKWVGWWGLCIFVFSFLFVQTDANRKLVPIWNTDCIQLLSSLSVSLNNILKRKTILNETEEEQVTSCDSNNSSHCTFIRITNFPPIFRWWKFLCGNRIANLNKTARQTSTIMMVATTMTTTAIIKVTTATIPRKRLKYIYANLCVFYSFIHDRIKSEM